MRSSAIGAVLVLAMSACAPGAAAQSMADPDPTGPFVRQGPPAPRPAWEIEDGRLEFTVTRFGAPARGRFADWSARITYEPRPDPGEAGQVVVVMDVGSLDLGSLTNQALGPDFFDVAAWPEARFEARLKRDMDGHVLDGTLTLHGRTNPLRIPVVLVESDGGIVAESQFTLDRMDFGIGSTIADPDILAREVMIEFELEARPSG